VVLEVCRRYQFRFPSWAAIAIGVSERTMERWSTNPEFKAYLSELDESANTKITVTVSNLSNTIDIEDIENYKYKDDGSSRIAQFLARRQSGCHPM